MAKMEWVSVEDSMPDKDIDVLVCAQRKGDEFGGERVIAMTRYTDRLFGFNLSGWVAPWVFFFEDYRITHWMYLPELPEEVNP